MADDRRTADRQDSASDRRTPEAAAWRESAGIELTADAPLLEVTDLKVDFPTDDGVVHAVRGVSFPLRRPARSLAIVGESGSGKSVTSLAIMGLLGKSARVSGSVKYRGVELLGMKTRDLAKLRGPGAGHDLPGPDDRRSTRCTGSAGSWPRPSAPTTRCREEGGAASAAVDLLRLVGIPNAEDRVAQLSRTSSPAACASGP